MHALDHVKIRKYFYKNSNSSNELVILTPIRTIIDKFKNSDKYEMTGQTEGWWSLCNFKEKASLASFDVMYFSPGLFVVDALKTINPLKTKNVILLGLCGSLSPKYKVGDIFIPDKFALNFSTLKTKYEIYPTLHKAEKAIATVPYMSMAKKDYYRMLEHGITAVDMESYFLYKWGEYNKIKVKSILVVSDSPLSKPFYVSDTRTYKVIDEALGTIVNNYI